VLGTGDSDREAAERLGLEYVSAPPFASISDEQHEDHLELVRAADHVVLLPMAVGMNNVRNVVAASGASSVIVVEPSVREGSLLDADSQDGTGVADFTDGIAEELRRGLIEKFGEIPESTLLFELARVTR
jgi:hypothetical protein